LHLENKKLVTVLALSIVLAVASASASPTVTTGNFVSTATSDVADTRTAIVPDSLKVIEAANCELAVIGRQLLKPSVNSAGLTNSPTDYAKALPAVPATCFMVLTGFLCISFVRDRRVWLAALTALLWAGQAGVQAVPQLAMYVYRRAHTNKQFAAPLDRSHLFGNTNRLRCDIEGTGFIGLLHCLEGIPESTMSFLRKQESRQTEHKFRTSQFAIATLLSRIICATNCPAVTVEQHIRFSPGFIFDNLARGPPALT